MLIFLAVNTYSDSLKIKSPDIYCFYSYYSTFQVFSVETSPMSFFSPNFCLSSIFLLPTLTEVASHL